MELRTQESSKLSLDKVQNIREITFHQKVQLTGVCTVFALKATFEITLFFLILQHCELCISN